MYKVNSLKDLTEKKLSDDEVLKIKAKYSAKELAGMIGVHVRTLENILNFKYKVRTTTSLRTYNKVVNFIREKIESETNNSENDLNEEVLEGVKEEFNFTI